MSHLILSGIDGFSVLLPKTTQHHCSQLLIPELFPDPLLFETPPITKGAIFKNTSLSLVEKHNLMKFITTFTLQGKERREHSENNSHQETPQTETISHRREETYLVDDPASIKLRVPISGMSSFLSAASIYSGECSLLTEKRPVNEDKSRELDQHPRRTTMLCESQGSKTWAEKLQRHHLSLGLRQRITYGLCLKNCLELSDYCSSEELSISQKQALGNFEWKEQTGFERLFLVASSFGKYCEGKLNRNRCLFKILIINI